MLPADEMLGQRPYTHLCMVTPVAELGFAQETTFEGGTRGREGNIS